MCCAKVEEDRKDSILARIPCIDDATLDKEAAERRCQRAEYLNRVGEIQHRDRHELGYSLAVQEIRQSGNQELLWDAFRSVWYRITFPQGTVLTDEIYGDGDGFLQLDAIVHTPDGINTTYDIVWKASIYEEKKRKGKDKDKKMKKKYTDAATKGMKGGPMLKMQMG